AWGNIIFNGNVEDIPLSRGQRGVSQWFNVNAVCFPNSAQQLANNLRTFPTRVSGVRGPGITNFDLSAIKSTRIHEKAKVEFRVESLNAMNHPLFANPNVEPTSSAFGVISAQNNNPR